MGGLILLIFFTILAYRASTRKNIGITYGNFKRVKVGWLLSHLYKDIGHNKEKDGKICLRALIYQIVNDVILIAVIVGLIIIWIKTENYIYLAIFDVGMISLLIISELCFLTPMRVKEKRLYQETIQRNINTNEEERQRKAEEAKLREENALKESVSQESIAEESYSKKDNSEDRDSEETSSK